MERDRPEPPPQPADRAPAAPSMDVDERTAIVVPGALAARQWEAHLGGADVAAHRSAWVTPALIGFGAWIENFWQSSRERRPLPLSPPQSLALWRRVISDSDEGAELIGDRGVAEWAAAAWELLCHWGLDPGRERAAGGQRDFQAFQGWCRSYRSALRTNGWVDRAEIARRLPDEQWRVPERVIFADLDEPSPRQEALLHRLAREGARVERWQPPAMAARCWRVRLADAAEELHGAVSWARARLASRPQSRVAIVVTDLAQRRTEIERVLVAEPGGEVATPVWHGGHAVGAAPRIGAALDAITLATRSGTFETFSRWLRSPFFGAAGPSEHAARAALERALRKDIRSQLPFVMAYRETSLADVVRRVAPGAADALRAALQETTGIERATPARWARVWQRSLTLLGWDVASDVRTLRPWQSALDDFVRLTPIVGELTQEAALTEIERVLERPAAAPLPLQGIHVFGRLDDVGPGYDAAWITGLTDTAWPEPARLNPLLPRALQREHGMPWSTPQDARARSARRLARLERRVATLVASWPARVYDYETEPSPALRAWDELPAAELAARARATPARRRETVADPAPPLAAAEIRGGVGVLRRQARCPLRAFCEDRLGAQALERVSAGVNARLRGIATHRALEWLLEDLPEHAQLRAKLDAAAALAERALGDVFRDARRPLRALFALEAERLATTLAALLRIDLARAPFRVAAVEQRQNVTIAGRDLRVRIDRLDRLADGGIAIVDYKTGDRASSADWFKDRLRDVQVPLYAAHSAAPVHAAVIARVRAGSAAYNGVWIGREFPGKPRKLPDARSWNEQIERWRVQVEQLVGEFVAGDTRFFANDPEEAAGQYAPLTRVDEQLALARGAVARW